MSYYEKQILEALALPEQTEDQARAKKRQIQKIFPATCDKRLREDGERLRIKICTEWPITFD